MNIEKEISYIYSYIKYTYFSINELKNERYLIDISRRIKKSLPNSNFSSGNLDFYINECVSQELTLRNSKTFKEYQKIKYHIYPIVDYYSRKKGIYNIDLMLTETIRCAVEIYDEREILSGSCDHDIEEIIERITPSFTPNKTIDTITIDLSNIAIKNDEINDSVDLIKNYIKEYLEKNKKYFIFNGSLTFLSDLIYMNIFDTNYKYEEVLNHKYDYLIDLCIRKELYGIVLKDEFKMMQIAVANKVLMNNTYMDIEDKELHIAEEIYDISRNLIEKGYTTKDVETNKCDSTIEMHVSLNCLKINSVNTNSKHDKIKLESKRTLISKRTKALVLALLIGIGTKSVMNNIEEKKEIEAYENFDTYSYPKTTTTGEEFLRTLDYILNMYDDYASYGKEYVQIILYKAYRSMQNDQFYSMDIMLNMLKSRTEYNDELSTLYEEIMQSGSYIEYVYNKLGNEEYKNAVEAYNAQVANYKELKPMTILESKDKKTVNTINRMMNEYSKYIESLEEEMGKDIVSERNK